MLICRPTAVVLAVGLRFCERNLDPWRLATAGPVVDRLSRPAPRQGGLDARLRLVVRHRHVYVDAVALRARRVHPLEPDGRALAQRVDQPVPGFGPAGLVGVAPSTACQNGRMAAASSVSLPISSTCTDRSS